jgi:hypothetical protein
MPALHLACCRWRTGLLTDAAITRLAAFKGVAEHDFIRKYMRLRLDRRGLILQESQTVNAFSRRE